MHLAEESVIEGGFFAAELRYTSLSKARLMSSPPNRQALNVMVRNLSALFLPRRSVAASSLSDDR